MFRLLTILFLGVALFAGCSSDDDGTEPDQPSLSISTDTLDFDSSDTLKTFSITNTGEGELTWSVGADSIWVELDPVTGTTTTETDAVTVTVDPDGKLSGTYESIVTVTSNAGTGTVVVNLSIGDPVLTLSEDTLKFGNTDTLMTFNITNTGEGVLTWSVDADSDWVELAPVSGTNTSETDVVTVMVDRTGKPAGGYRSVVTVTSDAGTDTVTVEMAVVEEVELTLPNEGFGNPSTVNVPLTVANFTGVAGVELHIAYDTLEITYDTVLSDYLISPTINASDGVVHVIWADIGSPVTATDGDTLLTLHFTDLDIESDLTFLGNCEIVDIQGDPLPVTFTDGHIFYEPFAR